MSNSKQEFTNLFLKGWKQKLCKVLDSDVLRVENEMDNPDDFISTEKAKLLKAIHEDIEITSKHIDLRETGGSRQNLVLSEVFTFTPEEFWGLIIYFGSMTGTERREFFNEYELSVYKGKTADENMID